MTLRYQTQDGILRVWLEGELGHHEAICLMSRLSALVEDHLPTQMELDLSALEFMDSSGIGVIMGRYRLMQSVGGKVCAFGITHRVDKLIEMSGIKRIVNIYTDEQTALRKEG